MTDVTMTDATRAKVMQSSQNQSSESSGGEAVQAASTLAKQAGGELKAVTRDAREHGRQLVTASTEELRGQAAAQTARLTDGLQDATRQLRRLAVGDPQPGVVADLVAQLADVTERAADRLQNGGIDGAMGDLRRIARNQTGLFLLGALGAGLVAGRVLRAVDTHSIAETAKESFAGSADHGASPDDAFSPTTLGTPDPARFSPPAEMGGVSAGMGAISGVTGQENTR